MPTNLPPQYFEAEKRFRQAKEPGEKIEALEEMLAVMPKHKGTDHLKADLRRKIAKLSQSFEKKLATQKASMLVEKEGAAQIVVIGMPNSGKSQLVSTLTSALPPVAEYPFTTQQATPGMMEFEDIQIQLIDTPPITEQNIEWWLPHMIRRADGMIVLLDLTDEPLLQMEILTEQLADRKIEPANIRMDEPGTVFRQRALLAGNKIDLPDSDVAFNELADNYGERLPIVAISAREGTGLEDLKINTYQMLDIIRVYTKAPGEKADLSDPIVLNKGSTLDDAAASVHKDFAAKLKYARLWGSGKHDGIMAKRNHVLQDGDIIELHM